LFRVGNNNFVDNFESGGMTAKVDVDSGIVLSPAIDKAVTFIISTLLLKPR
jgi:phage tail tube protein FII